LSGTNWCPVSVTPLYFIHIYNYRCRKSVDSVVHMYHIFYHVGTFILLICMVTLSLKLKLPRISFVGWWCFHWVSMHQSFCVVSLTCALLLNKIMHLLYEFYRSKINWPTNCSCCWKLDFSDVEHELIYSNGLLCDSLESIYWKLYFYWWQSRACLQKVGLFCDSLVSAHLQKNGLFWRHI
jgi:hypothetical protein